MLIAGPAVAVVGAMGAGIAAASDEGDCGEVKDRWDGDESANFFVCDMYGILPSPSCPHHLVSGGARDGAGGVGGDQ